MKFLIVIIVMVLLNACTSPSPYREASKNGFGYQHSKLTNEHYRVAFKARGNDVHQATDFAMLRAAELTLLQGYDWFAVLHRDTQIDRQPVSAPAYNSLSYHRTVTHRCGLLTCQTQSQPQYDAQLGIGSNSSSSTEVLLEIRLGKGVSPGGDNIFNATDVKNTLSSKTSH